MIKALFSTLRYTYLLINVQLAFLMILSLAIHTKYCNYFNIYCNIPVGMGRVLATWLAAGALLKWLARLLHCGQKVAGSHLTPPALLYKNYYSYFMRFQYAKYCNELHSV